MAILQATTIHPNPGVKWDDVQKSLKKGCDLARKHGAENVTVVAALPSKGAGFFARAIFSFERNQQLSVHEILRHVSREFFLQRNERADRFLYSTGVFQLYCDPIVRKRVVGRLRGNLLYRFQAGHDGGSIHA